MEETQALDLPYNIFPKSSEDLEDREVSPTAASRFQPAMQAPGWLIC